METEDACTEMFPIIEMSPAKPLFFPHFHESSARAVNACLTCHNIVNIGFAYRNIKLLYKKVTLGNG